MLSLVMFGVYPTFTTSTETLLYLPAGGEHDPQLQTIISVGASERNPELRLVRLHAQRRPGLVESEGWQEGITLGTTPS